MSTKTYTIVRSCAALEVPSDPSICAHCTTCGKPIKPGEVVNHVVDDRMSCAEPNNPLGRHYLCDSCLNKLGDKVKRGRSKYEEEPERAPIPGPEVEPW